jgi:hypothetical protein
MVKAKKEDSIKNKLIVISDLRTWNNVDFEKYLYDQSPGEFV